MEGPALFGAAVTELHRGAVGAVLQTAEGQTRLGDDVEEGALLRRVPGEGWKGRNGDESTPQSHTLLSCIVPFLQFKVHSYKCD